MAQILLCDRAMGPVSFKQHCGIDVQKLFSLSGNSGSVVSANRPYAIEGVKSDIATLAKLTHPTVAKPITKLSTSLGGDNVVALADVCSKLFEFNVGVLGASSAYYSSRVDGLVGAVKGYQAALMNYRQAVEQGIKNKSTYRARAQAAFVQMQEQFHHELSVVNHGVKARRGTPLTDFKRATNIANSSRSVASLNVESSVQASNLVKFSKYAKVLGDGLALIDFSSRIGNIHTTYKANDNWHKEMFIESSGFISGAVAGTLALNIGSAALFLVMAATPVGWVGLVIGGAAVVGVSAGASMLANKVSKSLASDVYDSIMSALDNL